VPHLAEAPVSEAISSLHGRINRKERRDHKEGPFSSQVFAAGSFQSPASHPSRSTLPTLPSRPCRPAPANVNPTESNQIQPNQGGIEKYLLVGLAGVAACSYPTSPLG
jgi:hypothetical protein